MSFDVQGESYDRFMGRYSEPLADQHAAWLGLAGGQRALDVGCGPGALTRRLVDALGVEAVAAVDPSEPFVQAARHRLPGVDIQQAPAERLPFDDDRFDHTTAQLVVHFMTDPVAGLAEMARVTTPGGWVSASVWDFAGGRAPLTPFWEVVSGLNSAAPDEANMAVAGVSELTRVAVAAGLGEVEAVELAVTLRHQTFEQWWEPYTLGVGPAGDYVRTLDSDGRRALREACRAALPEPPFDLTAVAWAIRGRA